MPYNNITKQASNDDRRINFSMHRFPSNKRTQLDFIHFKQLNNYHLTFIRNTNDVIMGSLIYINSL